MVRRIKQSKKVVDQKGRHGLVELEANVRAAAPSDVVAAAARRELFEGPDTALGMAVGVVPATAAAAPGKCDPAGVRRDNIGL